MSRDWERNFTNTMRETEDNLSRMRNRLDPARYKPIDSTLIDSPPDPAEQLSNGIPKIRLKTSPKAKERPVSAILTSSSPSYELYRHSAPSAGLVALLSEKLERQNKVIEQLSHQVQDLESGRRKNDVKVRDLEHQVNTLTTRMTENRGQYNLQTEQQIDDWQRDVRNRLDELHERITRQMTNGGTSDTYHSESALTMLARDLHEAKRMLQAECNALHHEIETLRTRLVKQEMDVTGQLMEGKEMGRRMDRLDRKLGKVQSDQQQVLSHHLGLSSSSHQPPPSRPYSAQKDVRDLKTEMSKLLASFSKLESASQVSRSSTGSAPSVVSTTTVSSSISGRRHRSYPSSVSSSSTKGPTKVSSSWQRVRHHKDRTKKRDTKPGNSDGSSTSLEDLSSSEISLPLSISHEEEEDEEKRRQSREAGGNQLVDDDEDEDDDDVDVDDFQDDLSLYLSDLDVSHKGEDFGSTISLDSGNLDLDFM